MTKTPQMRPLAECLRLVAHELVELSGMSGRLEDVLARLAGAGADHQLMADLQAADLLTQRLDGVAGFVAFLAEATPADDCADIAAATRDLTLSDQARRFGGETAPQSAGDPIGELVLFGD